MLWHSWIKLLKKPLKSLPECLLSNFRHKIDFSFHIEIFSEEIRFDLNSVIVKTAQLHKRFSCFDYISVRVVLVAPINE